MEQVFFKVLLQFPGCFNLIEYTCNHLFGRLPSFQTWLLACWWSWGGTYLSFQPSYLCNFHLGNLSDHYLYPCSNLNSHLIVDSICKNPAFGFPNPLKTLQPLYEIMYIYFFIDHSGQQQKEYMNFSFLVKYYEPMSIAFVHTFSVGPLIQPWIQFFPLNLMY